MVRAPFAVRHCRPIRRVPVRRRSNRPRHHSAPLEMVKPAIKMSGAPFRDSRYDTDGPLKLSMNSSCQTLSPVTVIVPVRSPTPKLNPYPIPVAMVLGRFTSKFPSSAQLGGVEPNVELILSDPPPLYAACSEGAIYQSEGHIGTFGDSVLDARRRTRPRKLMCAPIHSQNELR